MQKRGRPRAKPESTEAAEHSAESPLASTVLTPVLPSQGHSCFVGWGSLQCGGMSHLDTQSTCRLESVWSICGGPLVSFVPIQWTACPWRLRKMVNLDSCLPDSPGVENPNFAGARPWEKHWSEIATTSTTELSGAPRALECDFLLFMVPCSAVRSHQCSRCWL